MREIEHERIAASLIGAAYEAATGNGSWEEFVRASGAAFPWSKTGFASSTGRSNTAPPSPWSTTIPPICKREKAGVGQQAELMRLLTKIIALV